MTPFKPSVFAGYQIFIGPRAFFITTNQRSFTTMLRIASASRRSPAALVMAKRAASVSVGEGKRVTPPPPPPVYKGDAPAPLPKKVSPPPPPRTEAKPKKFSLWGFLFKTALLAGGAYGLTLYAATKNDKVMDFVIDNDLPYHDQLIDFIETTSADDLKQYAEELKESVANFKLPLSLDVADIRDKLQQKSLELAHKLGEIAHKAKQKIDLATHHRTPAEQLQNVEVEAVTRDVKRLPLVDQLLVLDPQVRLMVASLNQLIGLIDATTVDPKLVKVIGDQVKQLLTKLLLLTGDFDHSVQDKLKLLQTELLLQATKKELDLTETLLLQYNLEKGQLEKKLNQQLQREVEATKQTIEQAAVNAVTMVRINQTKEFEQLVTEKIDSERDGRLANLEKLNLRLGDLEKFAEGLEKQVVANQKRQKLHRTVVELKTLLFDYPETLPPKLLRPVVNELIALSNEANDPLLEEALRNLGPLIATESTHSLLNNAQLLARFDQLAPELRLASLLPPNAGLLGHLASQVFSKLLLPVKGTNPNGNDIELVIGRVEDALTHNRLDDAVEEVAHLKGWPRKLADDWLQLGRQRLEVEFLVDLIDAESRVI